MAYLGVQPQPNFNYNYAVATGTVNNISAVIATTLVALVDGYPVTLRATGANTSTVSLTLTLGATVQASYPIVKYNNQPLAAGDISGSSCLIDLTFSTVYNAFVLLNPKDIMGGAIQMCGAIQMWPTNTAPNGFLICNGQAVSRTTYDALFSVIGVTFGAGDGSTTFNLPNYVDRMPIGAGTIANIAGTGGSKDSVVVSHTHAATVTDPGHVHSVTAQNIGPRITGGSGNFFTDGGQTGAATTGISVSNSTTGSSGTNANLPPYLGINFIIKT